MDFTPDNMEQMLSELGRAHREQGFAAKAPCPWKVAKPAKKVAMPVKRLAVLRFAVPLAAAAALAFVVVGPNLSSPKRIQVAPVAPPTSISSDVVHEAVVSAAGSAATVPTLDCDYNSDGLVDGRDIQGLVDRLKDLREDPRQQAETLQRCLLGA